ncbi:MAG: hypothetical protein CR991_02165 [Proteobacteria bacterium]|nr:MAG: hypothetical protein CR991_02165 [Pseudomonadota bacterium]
MNREGIHSKKVCCSWTKSALGTLLLACTCASYADSGIIEQEGIIRLVATLEDNPAFTNVVWKVYRMNGIYQSVEVIPRHTATLTLKPGNYKAVAILNNKRRSRNFQLKSNQQEEIILSMD